ncbi:COMM domain-containing protein 2 [Crotalus adamanteus]|uniref:COMM domain-containing protein 2 n=1 Tax=Crotalus adamanteus TaxID=8729 RepID=A0AAW1BIH3_CROAD
MLLVLSEEHKEHLGFLPQVESSVVNEFGRIAIEFLRKGTNPKVYEGAAKKLNVNSETIQHGVEGLTYLLTESSKLMISEIDFQDSILVLQFPEELNALLLQLYLDNRKEIRNILSELTPKFPSYHNLEWRLDVQLASRTHPQEAPVSQLKNPAGSGSLKRAVGGRTGKWVYRVIGLVLDAELMNNAAAKLSVPP